MRAPAKRGTAIDAARIEGWVDRFAYYSHPPSKLKIQAWLDRFSSDDQDIAARILDCVEIISSEEVHKGYRRALEDLPGWHPNKSDRDGNWLFVGFGHAGESGQSMANVFRTANRLSSDKYDYLFCTARELPSKKLTAEDTVVFIDDFSGTGDQVCRKWPELYELVATDAEFFLILTAATEAAVAQIHEKTALKVRTRYRIHKNENFFSSACIRFKGEERDAILPYCRRADSQMPKGFGECGLMYVLHHKTPNNSLPILHANHSTWRGIFPRYV